MPRFNVRPDPLQGRIILGRYRILSKIAKGGMASVYLARNVNDGSQFAVKILHGYLASDLGLRERFINESLAMRLINHPAVVKVWEVGELDQRTCLIMEYVNGHSLRKLIERGPMRTATVIMLSSSISVGLAVSHDTGIIHRDLKPDNILLPKVVSKEESLVKLIDFGIARIQDSPPITTTQHVMGTPQYIAPEQALGNHIDHRVDIYALGVLMYEMLTGELPFSAPDPDTLLRQHVSVAPPPFVALNAPPALQELVMSCLEKERDNRPCDMTDIINFLNSI